MNLTCHAIDEPLWNRRAPKSSKIDENGQVSTFIEIDENNRILRPMKLDENRRNAKLMKTTEPQNLWKLMKLDENCQTRDQNGWKRLMRKIDENWKESTPKIDENLRKPPKLKIDENSRSQIS